MDVQRTGSLDQTSRQLKWSKEGKQAKDVQRTGALDQTSRQLKRSKEGKRANRIEKTRRYRYSLE